MAGYKRDLRSPTGRPRACPCAVVHSTAPSGREPAPPNSTKPKSEAEPMSGTDPGGRVYLEDLHVGQRFLSGTHALDERQVIAFASEFDPQPFHTNAAQAKDLFFGGLVASGWHTAAITMRLMVTSGLPIARGLIGAE